MNCGLSNLDRLKRHLLAAGTLAGETRFDEVVADLGQGVAAEFETFCGRKFARLVDDVAVFPADRVHFVLPRYPIESIKTVKVKRSEAGTFVEQAAGFVKTISAAAGIVYLPEPDAGPYDAEVQFTYTGGYWFETLEPEESGYPSAVPAGATALPKDLRLAWVNHCRAVWDAWDKLGVGLVDKPKVQTVIGEVDWSASVKRTLAMYQVVQPI